MTVKGATDKAKSNSKTAVSYLPYRDASLPIDERVEDLLARMNLAEKVGQMFHDAINAGPDDVPSVVGGGSTAVKVCNKLMTHFNLLDPICDVRATAEWYNHLQEMALSTRLGIPITLSSDPRHHFSDHAGVSASAGALSLWPEMIGLAAIRSKELVERFADVARQEYVALGLRVALHPQIDLATEPRWSRISATFGEDATLTSELVSAYIRGFQGVTLGSSSVATMIKHFPGGGPEKDGEDPHFKYGREQVYPGNNFEYHLAPFIAALDAGGSQVMPSYGMPMDTKYDEVAFGFNKSVITGILREQLGFKGIVCTDWGLLTDVVFAGENVPARAWGVEHLSSLERAKLVLDAGCDQFGGEERTDLLLELVIQGLVPESRLDEAVRRILKEKFVLGLFDQPFIDVEAAVKEVGHPIFRQEGERTQRRAYTLLTNHNDILPLQSGSKPKKVYIEGISALAVTARGLLVVDSPNSADLAILRLRAPYEPRPGSLERYFHAGSLEFPESEKSRQAAVFATVPTIVDMYLDRPAVFPEIVQAAAALVVSYGSSDEACLDVLFGLAKPEGRLPFDLPSSMKAVKASRSDMPYDTDEPTFRFGDGLEY